MAAKHKCSIAIDRAKLSEVEVPWCDEYEKMICGMNFKAGNAQQMMDHKVNMKRRLKDFNDDSIPEGSTLASLKACRMSIAKKFLGKLGKDTNIEAPFFVTFGCNVFLGQEVYVNRGVSIHDSAAVTIGDRVLIGPGVNICTDTHEVEPTHRRESNNGSYAKKIKIGNDVWIGMNSCILPGVTIGNGCTIAGGAVVADDVKPFTMVGGVPATFIRDLKPTEPSA